MATPYWAELLGVSVKVVQVDENYIRIKFRKCVNVCKQSMHQDYVPGFSQA